VFGTHHQALKAVDEAFSQASVTQTEGTVVVRVPRPSRKEEAQRLVEQRREAKLSIYQKVWDLHHSGWKAKAMPTAGCAYARKLGIGVTSVFRYLRTSTFPEPQARRSLGRSILMPYHKYILQRWNEGCREALVLFQEIQQLSLHR